MQVGSKVYNVDPGVTALPQDIELEIERIETTQLPCSVINDVQGKKQVVTKMMPATWFFIKGFTGRFRKYSFETPEGYAYIKQLESDQNQVVS